jgi:hypothetical protein
LPFIDEIVGGVIAKAHKQGVLDNTIILFVALPAEDENGDSPIESHYRRTAFIYSSKLALPQSISNQLVHISDILPTLVNATSLKWLTRDRIYIDGVNQWPALNSNVDVRDSIFGDNFYIEGNWKLSYGAARDVIYDSIGNQNMELSDSDGYDLHSYVKSIIGADIDPYLDDLSVNKIILMRNRAKVHCNLNDVDGSTFLINIKCTQASPCLFDLQSDPCELDDKHDHEFEARRERMRTRFETYLEGGLAALTAEVDVHGHAETTTEDDSGVTRDPILSPSGGFGAFLTLMATLFVFIFLLIFITCIKERCNSRRSVYDDKTKKVTFKDESGATISEGVTTISSQVQKQQTRL